MVVSDEPRRRLFIAAPLPAEVRMALADRLGSTPVPGRVVPPENWHLTLRFLGWADTTGYERVLAALDESDLGPSFQVKLGQMGAFPRPGKATVLWLDIVEGKTRLAELAALSDEAALAAGFPAEERPYQAHLTVSRVRPPEDVTAMIEGAPDVGVGWPCTSVVVYQSHLGRGGARYEPLETFPLTR
jgi:2'-5' RNA ligase